MKKLILLLFIPLFFACSNIEVWVAQTEHHSFQELITIVFPSVFSLLNSFKEKPDDFSKLKLENGKTVKQITNIKFFNLIMLFFW